MLANEHLHATQSKMKIQSNTIPFESLGIGLIMSATLHCQRHVEHKHRQTMLLRSIPDEQFTQVGPPLSYRHLMAVTQPGSFTWIHQFAFLSLLLSTMTWSLLPHVGCGS